MTMATGATVRGTVKGVDARTLHGWLAAGEVDLVDVREPSMHRAERIAGARSIPLAAVDPAALPGAAGRKLVFHCEIGKASATAAQRLVDAGRADVYNLEGGLQRWKQAGLPVEGDAGAPIPLIRQMQLVAGGLVFLGTVLGVTVSPWFLLLSGGVGAGLVFAGASGTCPMSAVLLRLPYNR
jgi:rhodanese-related sulfurtransferase